MIHRHLDYSADTPIDERGAAALDDLLDRGDLEDWAPLARAVARRPWGVTATRVLDLCDAHPMYGTSALWRAFVRGCRVSGPGRSRPLPLRTLAEVRVACGMTQAEVGLRLGMNQSQVSRLERRSDLRLSTLRAFVAATGADLQLVAVRPPGSDGAPRRSLIQPPRTD